MFSTKKLKWRSAILIAGLAAIFVIAGCSDSDDNGVTPPVQHSITLNVNGLEPLGTGFLYEGWIIVGGNPVSTGTFNVAASGGLIDENGDAIANSEFAISSDPSEIAAVVISIEPNPDSNPAPSGTKILGGDLVMGTLDEYNVPLSVGHAAAFGNDFASVMGNYILATPTNGADTDENSGIWFLKIDGSPMVGLELPMLPGGWLYEGWVVINGVPVTTGKFSTVDEMDSADPYSSVEPGPPFPGEDFLQNTPAGLMFPTDIAGGTAVISIEPNPDDGSSPFALKPLVSAIPMGAMDHTNYSMTAQTPQVSGSAVVQ